jgi:Domain of unknown function (DUF4347)
MLVSGSSTNPLAVELSTTVAPSSAAPLALSSSPSISPWSSPVRSATSLVFVDAGVQGADRWLEDRPQGTEVIYLNPLEDAIGQITQTLLGRSGIASLQIVSHGASGGVKLGADWLSLDTLGGYESQVRSWAQAMTATGDILLYGCNVAQGEPGHAFVQALHQLTGRDIGASSDVTGSAALGGNWTLEVQAGQIETELETRWASGYQGTLETTLISQVDPLSISDTAGGSMTGQPRWQLCGV